MKLFFNVVILTLSILFCTSALAIDTFKDEAAIRNFTDKFMKKVGSGDLQGAYDFLKPYSAVNSVELDSAVEESRQYRQKKAMQFGPSKGYEFISEKKVGSILYRLIYIEITEKQVVPWAFYFFKTDNIWKLDDFYWTDQVLGLFQ